ncbi:MAG: excinuclease ABC subunit UvrB [Rikenellaceae bacterium]
MGFQLKANYKPTGDQPQAIEQLVAALRQGKRHNTLLGVTGSGKTFTMANVIDELDRPTLVICHNKTLAAQLYTEFKNFFPDNAVEYYVSYYDYYQPEAYLPTTGTYIEKDLSINDEIERMRLKTTSTLLSGRRDVIVVSSVSCIYGIGNPEDFKANSLTLKVGEAAPMKEMLYRLVEALYTRVKKELTAATFRVNGDSIDIMSAYGEQCYRVTLFDDEIESITTIDAVTGERFVRMEQITIPPANLFVTTKERIAKAMSQIRYDMECQAAEFERNDRMIEGQRLRQRVEYDLEMIKELGYCSGIENYSRYFDNRKPGMAPFTLLNYFPEDFLTIIDESHVTVPQVRGMYGGDAARKINLIEYGFRLEAAKDNRPLRYDEFSHMLNSVIYVSATPGEYEIEAANNELVMQLIRPTGLIDPPMLLRLPLTQIDDLVNEINMAVAKGDKVITTTITKRMAEDLSKYLDRLGIRNRYIHSDIDTMERIRILDDLRKDLFDVLVGVNLLREGLDLPEVGVVAILDADKDGFLRNARSLTQITGRAARHAKGVALLYGNVCTDSLASSIMASNRNRMAQVRYNMQHNLFPRQAERSGDNGGNQLLAQRVAEEVEATPIVRYPIKEPKPMPMAASPTASYTAGDRTVGGSNQPQGVSYRKGGVVNYITGEVTFPDEEPRGGVDYDSQIADAKAQMEAAAKSLDFGAAIKYRDLMFKLTKERDAKR